MLNNLQAIMGEYKTPNRYEQTKKLVDRWAPSGLLEGLQNDEKKQHVMAQLLDNQAKQLLAEASTTSTTANTEA